MRRLFFVFGILSFGMIVSAASPRISLKVLTEELSDGYRAKGGEGKKRLAILDVGADRELADRGVSAFLNEMITHEFVKRPEFIVLERELFDRVLEEHKLQAQFGDMETAVKVGRVLGAQVVFVGRINQIQDQVRLNGRLVNTETTEILSTAVQDIPVDEFRKDDLSVARAAAMQRKFSFAMLYSFQAKGSNETVAHAGGSGSTAFTETLRYEPPSPNWAGAQLGYYFIDRYFVTASYQVEARQQSLGRIDIDYTAPGGDVSYDIKASGRLVRAGVGVNKVLSRLFEASLSAGWTSLKYAPKAGGAGIEAEVNESFPYAGLGVAFLPESRLSIGIGVTHDFNALEGKFRKNGQTAFKLNPLSAGASVIFYF